MTAGMHPFFAGRRGFLYIFALNNKYIICVKIIKICVL